jgi:hypothetical protein
MVFPGSMISGNAVLPPGLFGALPEVGVIFPPPSSGMGLLSPPDDGGGGGGGVTLEGVWVEARLVVELGDEALGEMALLFVVLAVLPILVEGEPAVLVDVGLERFLAITAPSGLVIDLPESSFPVFPPP